MTEPEAVEYCQQQGMSLRDAQDKVNRGLLDEPCPPFFDRTHDDGLDRWRDCLETIEMVHGRDAVQEVLKLMEE